MPNKLDFIYERLKNVNPTFGPPSNCSGAALYLVNILERDCFLDLKKGYRKYLRNLPELDSPLESSLVSWEMLDKKRRIKLVHLGVVSNIQPLKIIYRNGAWEESLEENAVILEEGFEKVNSKHSTKTDFIKAQQEIRAF